ncbi:enterochelin esterase, partial [Microbacterium sp. zg.Y909]|nr:enterochelin esterase [Microbacterium sp. zg.Y909]
MMMPFVPLPLEQADVDYVYGPDSFTRLGVQPGSIEEIRIDTSARFPGTSRTIWVHRPAGVRTSAECAVMFFNDGWWYLDPEGDVRGATVLDNLSAAGDLPPMVSVFVDPGVLHVDAVPMKHRN